MSLPVALGLWVLLSDQPHQSLASLLGSLDFASISPPQVSKLTSLERVPVPASRSLGLIVDSSKGDRRCSDEMTWFPSGSWRRGREEG